MKRVPWKTAQKKRTVDTRTCKIAQRTYKEAVFTVARDNRDSMTYILVTHPGTSYSYTHSENKDVGGPLLLSQHISCIYSVHCKIQNTKRYL